MDKVKRITKTDADRCVHTEHCCIVHGCKYGHDDCPVTLGVKDQSHSCEDCVYPGWHADDYQDELGPLIAQLKEKEHD